MGARFDIDQRRCLPWLYPAAACEPWINMPRLLYRYIVQTTARQQLWLCLLTGVVVLLSWAPLELQRRIVDDALHQRDLKLLALLGGIYLAILRSQGGLKYLLNVSRGRLVERVTRRLRQTVYQAIGVAPATRTDAAEEQRLESGAVVSIVAAETEDVAGFVGDSLSLPLLQGGTLLAVAGYLALLNPLIAGIAVAVYLPQLILVPPLQRRINRYAALHARQVRSIGNEVVRRMDGGERGQSRAEQFHRLVKRAYDSRLRIFALKYFLTFLGNFLDALGPLSIFMVGGWFVIERGTDIATLVVFISGFQKIAGPWDELITFYRTATTAQTRYALVREAVA
jgi:ABC-type multidrug transport system fused ATPase/permease subunit